MVKIFEALDNEFAVSTGDNVNDTPGRSIFDYPPNSTKDFVVTSNPGDSSPNIFDIGDTYDLSWGGHGGGGTIEDATVIRSDAAPGDGGVIVFEGLDENGELVQVVWSPGFDLEGWYWDSHFDGSPTGFWTTDQNVSYTHSFVCFGAETPIKTITGWARADQVKAGDRVWTLDDGYQPVLWAGQRTVAGAGKCVPVVFAKGSIGNTQPLRLSQQHRVLIRSPLAELMMAHHEVLAPAKSFVGEHGITYGTCQEVTFVHLLLQQHHILNAAGALCESLFMGHETNDILTPDIARSAVFRRLHLSHIAARPMLTYREARCLVGARLSISPPATV